MELLHARAVLTGLLLKIFTEKFQVLARKKAQEIIDCISRKNAGKLASVTLIDSSWDDANELMSVLSEHLSLWSEQDGREYIIDPFDEKRLVCYGLIRGHKPYTFTYDYILTSCGEPLVLRLEIEMYIGGNGDTVSTLNINA